MWYNKECNGGVTWLTHTQQCVTHLKQIGLNIFHGDIDFIGIYWVYVLYVQCYIQLLHIDIYRYNGVSESQTIQTNLSAILEPEYCTTQTWEFQSSFWISEFWIDFGTSTRCPMYMYIYIYKYTPSVFHDSDYSTSFKMPKSLKRSIFNNFPAEKKTCLLPGSSLAGRDGQ